MLLTKEKYMFAFKLGSVQQQLFRSVEKDIQC